MHKAFRIVASIYQMYIAKNLDIPYFRTCMTIVGPLTIFILSILEMAHFSFAAFFSKLNGNDSFFTIAFINAYFFTVIVAFYLLFNKQKVLKVEVNEEDIKAAKRRVPIMFVSLAVLLTILLIIRGVEKGTITL